MQTKVDKFLQQFFDYADKHDYDCEQVGYIQDKDTQWYPANKRVSDDLAIRLNFIISPDNDYTIYVENFLNKNGEWFLHANKLEFKSTCKITLEEALSKWNHQLTI